MYFVRIYCISVIRFYCSYVCINHNYVINDIAIPVLKVTKKSIVDDELNLKEGDEISYEIEVTNEGAYVAKNVRIKYFS